MSSVWPRRISNILSASAVVVIVIGLIPADQRERKFSEVQANLFTSISDDLSFKLRAGPSSSIRFPEYGPYDLRLGYAGIPSFIRRLEDRGFEIVAQSRFSPQLVKLYDRGIFTIYPEKSQSGLKILDREDHAIFEAVYPARVYPDFEAIPRVILESLLFIENRELLNQNNQFLNPAVEWDRLGVAAFDLIRKKLGADIRVAGGSTLATQLEKFRHSRNGITESPAEKVRQMVSASIRTYSSGLDTLKARQGIALTYLNAVPLAASPGYGEVQGIGDGLAVWYGADFDTVNRLLHEKSLANDNRVSAEQGRAYRKVLSLLLAQRRPSFFLRRGHANLQKLANSYLNLLRAADVIPPGLYHAARNARISLRQDPVESQNSPFTERKTQNLIRTRLKDVLGVDSLYNLDRMDITAKSTLDQNAQALLREVLNGLGQLDNAKAAGITGFRLLGADNDPSKVVYSLALFESTPYGNMMRVQIDNYDQPLDITEGIRLDLGSTAKLRTTVHYLQLVDELYHQYSETPADELRQLDFYPRDYLSRWVVDQLLKKNPPTFPEILDAALERRYSANPGESFFTGGGIHTFSNFNKADNAKIISVKEALRDSVNLVFIRLMREITYHYLYRPGGVARRLEEGDEELRLQYLGRFADQEGKVFLRRFYAKYKNQSTDERENEFIQQIRPLPARLATVYRSLYPDRDLRQFADFLKTRLSGRKLSDKQIESLYEQYSMEAFNLQDRGYIARVHPLELWLLAHLIQSPEARLSELIEASADERQEIYQWLFKSNGKYKQDKRIRSIMEVEAFEQIGAAWRGLGYPFSRMTPSYASAIGASGDRPSALAELMGILVNQGIRHPWVRFESFHFAAGTPYETLMRVKPSKGHRVLSAEVAEAVRKALLDVVDNGTAVRLRGRFKDRNGELMRVGGKTGTGDHVRRIFGSGGRIVGSRVISRTATFVFFLGDRFFGTITSYVTGEEAAKYHFTSTLSVQVLKSLNPILEPLVNSPPRPDFLPADLLTASDSPAAKK